MMTVAKPFMLYFIGISGSGKTTIATALEKRMKGSGVEKLQFIDGDEIRSELGDLFGYTYEERMKNNKVVCVVAKYLVNNGINVILAQVAGHERMREQVREHFPKEYLEVYIRCSEEECARRDVKGYYKKAKEGRMNNLNGVNDTFEVPLHSDIVVNTEKTSVEEAVDIIIEYMVENGYVI